MLDRLSDIYLGLLENPLFQFFSGILLGLMVMGALWMIATVNRLNKQIAMMEEEKGVLEIDDAVSSENSDSPTVTQ